MTGEVRWSGARGGRAEAETGADSGFGLLDPVRYPHRQKGIAPVHAFPIYFSSAPPREPAFRVRDARADDPAPTSTAGTEFERLKPESISRKDAETQRRSENAGDSGFGLRDPVRYPHVQKRIAPVHAVPIYFSSASLRLRENLLFA
jgi:hypothetical protein